MVGLEIKRPLIHILWIRGGLHKKFYIKSGFGTFDQGQQAEAIFVTMAVEIKLKRLSLTDTNLCSVDAGIMRHYLEIRGGRVVNGVHREVSRPKPKRPQDPRVLAVGDK